MARSTGLETLVGLLKRSVIDLYMDDEGWKWKRGDDYYVEEIDWVEKYLPVFHDKAMACVRPNEWGFHGGEVYDSLDDAHRGGRPLGHVSYAAKFSEIGDRIDATVERWYDLPDPVEIGEAVRAYTAVVDQLCRGTNEQLTGEGTLGPNMTRIWDDLIGHVEEGGYYVPALSGGAVETFKGYVRNLDFAVGGCGEIAIALEMYVDAQRQLWEAVRSNVSAIISSVTGACDAIVGQQSRSGPVSLQDLGIVLGGVSVIGGPIGLAATGAGLLVTAIDEVKNSPIQREVEIESHEGALDLLDKLLNRSFHGFGVNEMIKIFERNACGGITANIQEVETRRNMLDLVPGVIETVDGVIRHDKEKAGNIARRLDSVSVELGNMAWLLSRCLPMVPPRFITNILVRDSRIGIGRDGPTDALSALTDLLKVILTELSGEVFAGAENFKAAMAALDRADSDTQAALAAAAQAYGLSDRGGIDSFDFHPWTPDGQAETAERAARDALGLFGGSSSSAERASDPLGPDTGALRPLINWHLMLGEQPDGVDPSTDQLWCDAEPDNGKVVIRPQPEKP